MIILYLPVTVLYYNKPFPSYPKNLFQSEAKCKAIDMEMSFDCHANTTYFQKKGFDLSLVRFESESFLNVEMVYLMTAQKHSKGVLIWED